MASQDLTSQRAKQLAVFGLQAAAFVGLGYALGSRLRDGRSAPQATPATAAKKKTPKEQRVPRMVGATRPENHDQLLALRAQRLAEKEKQRELNAIPSNQQVLKGFDGVGEGEAAPRLRRAEAVLRQRTGRICAVLETTCDARNETAVLRTAEALGIQHVMIIDDINEKKNTHIAQKITKGADLWLNIRRYPTVAECVAQLRQEGYELWATDLSPEALNLDDDRPTLPRKVAVIFGRELDGVSPELLQAADRRIYIPMHGFTESFNLSVAAALTLQRLFLLCPEARGDLAVQERNTLRRAWYQSLTGADNQEQLAALEPWLKKAEAGEVEPLADLRKDAVLADKVRLPPKVRRKMEARYAGQGDVAANGDA
eukprot:TRINITY_DN10156_c0_g1_i3.p1 TRINITY_DN10156_c0_g1~~TRINITY_DN10156_c0_g1_i3.p1  ORF type:complete len:371 (+),score=97.35 TRINITY_DN10156_c0_g1_i3:74-1186(+)